MSKPIGPQSGPRPDIRTQSGETSATVQLIDAWIAARGSEDGVRWLRDRCDRIADTGAQWLFFASFSSVPRYLGKADLSLDEADLDAARARRSFWDPSQWSLDQAGRTLLLLIYPPDEADPYQETIEKMFETADVRESVALFQALPLLPYPERWLFRATEGVRSNMGPVFDAVALRNPYPAEHFDENQWNQMVLKAVFVGSPLHLIQGLDERANSELARMLVDYARERRAASRPVPPELWRLVGRFTRDEWITDLEQMLLSGNPREQEAAALALAESPSGRAGSFLAEQPEWTNRIRRGELSWNRLAGSHS